MYPNFSQRTRSFVFALLLLCCTSVSITSEAAELTKDSFLTMLFQARGFEAKKAEQNKTAEIVLKSGIITDAVSNLKQGITRREALRWSIQSLGLSIEANILADLPLPFKDSHTLSRFERGCLFVATKMTPALFKTATLFEPNRKLSPNEAKALMDTLRKASQSLHFTVNISPAPGFSLEIYREGAFSGIPKWRVYADGFDDKNEVEEMRKYLASQGFKTEANNPNYEWNLKSELFENYSQVRRLAHLIKTRGKAYRIFPSVINSNLSNQPLYWALLTADPAKYSMEPIFSPEGLTNLAPLSAMAKNSNAKAAINAGFFAISGRNRGAPIGTLRIRQTLLNKPYDGRTNLGWNKANRAAFGGLQWQGSIALQEGQLDINSINRYIKGNIVTLYTPHYGKATPISDTVTEIVVKAGKCLSINNNGGTTIETGTFILAGYGTNASILQEHFAIGDKIRIESLFNAGDAHWEGMEHIIQAGPFLMNNGEINIEAEGFSHSIINLRHPRSVVGLTEKGKWFFFVGDGRNNMHSAGFTLQEVALLLKNKGAAYALNLDGGGSTQIIVGAKIFNSPSDGRERPISYGLSFKPRS